MPTKADELYERQKRERLRKRRSEKTLKANAAKREREAAAAAVEELKKAAAEIKKYPEPTKPKRKVPDGAVAKFPREKFLSFCRQLKIQSKDAGVIQFELLGSQLYVLDEICSGLDEGITTFVILKARQLGISTFFLALDLFWAFEYPGVIGVFATHDEGSRDQFRNQIEVFLQGLPKSHKIEYETNNRLMLVLKNLSMFRYLVAGTRTTTNKLGRSGGCNYSHETECAFWGSSEDAKALDQTKSELYPHRLYVKESTANGFNHYEETYRIAEESPAQRAIFIGWWRDERNEFSESHPLYLQYMPQGTKTTLTAFERQKIKEVKKLYGFDITAGQIAWYRFHLETKCSGDQSMMNQEMPWTADDAFISSGSNFFGTETLTELSKEAKKHLLQPFVFRMSDDFMQTELQRISSPARAELKIWEMPVRGAKYVFGADPIFGSDDQRDNGVIAIGRAYADCVVQVAEYVSGSLSAHQFAWTIAYLGGLYQDVMLTLEMSGPGSVVFEELKQLKQRLAMITPGVDDDMRNCLRHMKNFMYARSDSLSGNFLLQWKSSPELRTQLLTKFRDGITAKRLKIRSMHCIDEMRHLTIDEGYISVPAGKKDDRVFGNALMYWGWDMRVRPRLFRQQGMTLIETQERELNGDPTQISGMYQRFLQNANIDVKT